MKTAATTLLIGKTEPARRAVAQKLAVELLGDANPKYDILIIDALKIMREEEKKSVGIEHSRQLLKFVKEKPLQHSCKVALIIEAQFLTVDAGNALLKTLEEPPANTYLILTAPQKDSLLPTIVSRCRVVKLTGNDNTGSIAQFSAAPPIALTNPKADLLDWVAKNKEVLDDKNELLQMLTNWEAALEQQLLATGDNTKTIERLWNLRQTLTTTTASPRLAIEEFLLKQ